MIEKVKLNLTAGFAIKVDNCQKFTGQRKKSHFNFSAISFSFISVILTILMTIYKCVKMIAI